MDEVGVRGGIGEVKTIQMCYVHVPPSTLNVIITYSKALIKIKNKFKKRKGLVLKII